MEGNPLKHLVEQAKPLLYRAPEHMDSADVWYVRKAGEAQMAIVNALMKLPSKEPSRFKALHHWVKK